MGQHIAVVCSLRRLFANLQLSTHHINLVPDIRPQQFRVGIRDECEAAVLASRRYLSDIAAVN
jgi:hypothetical protein